MTKKNENGIDGERLKAICLETLGRLQMLFGQGYRLSLVIRSVEGDEESLMFSADEPGALERVVKFLVTRDRTTPGGGT